MSKHRQFSVKCHLFQFVIVFPFPPHLFASNEKAAVLPFRIGSCAIFKRGCTATVVQRKMPKLVGFSLLKKRKSMFSLKDHYFCAERWWLLHPSSPGSCFNYRLQLIFREQFSMPPAEPCGNSFISFWFIGEISCIKHLLILLWMRYLWSPSHFI